MLLIKRFSLIVALFILCLCSLAEMKTVQTDASEIFSLNINQDKTLRFFYVGYQLVDIKPGTSYKLSVSLQQPVNTLSEVVVTAMDKKEVRELGYSAQNIKGPGTQRTPEPHVLSDLEIL